MTQPNPTSQDPDLNLDLFLFPIPNLTALRAVMVAERKATGEINAAIKNIAHNAGSSLVDPMGHPLPLAGGSVPERIKELTLALLADPILSASYTIAPCTNGSEPTLTQFSPAGIKLAFLVYQGLGMLMHNHLGANVAESVIKSLDMIVVFSLQAMKNHRSPYQVVKKALQFKAMDAATGAPVVGEPAWADQVRRDVTMLTFIFLMASGYSVASVAPDEAKAMLFADDADAPHLSLSENGERLYLHLRDQVALKMAMIQQGTVLTQEAMASAPETKTQSDIAHDHLLNPNSVLHKA